MEEITLEHDTAKLIEIINELKEENEILTQSLLAATTEVLKLQEELRDKNGYVDRTKRGNRMIY